MQLTFEQARVVGALIEKQMTTPDYYPMTVNALVAACNQKNNREPVTAFDDADVERLLGELNDLELTRYTRASGSRTLKYVHRGLDVWEVDEEQLAILAIMLLRGPQTIPELKSRTERYMEFGDLDAVEARVRDLMTRDEPLVVETPRASGQREARFHTLLTDHPGNHAPDSGAQATSGDPAGSRTSPLEARVTTLETTIAFLLEELGLDAPAPRPHLDEAGTPPDRA